ncbi:hypothetical protein KA005_05585 [bacterium]|nr:hypothetical protein [bacterium]
MKYDTIEKQRELINDYREGNTDAAKIILNESDPIIKKAIRNYHSDKEGSTEKEDHSQEIKIKILEEIKKQSIDTNLWAYIKAISKNYLNEQHRRALTKKRDPGTIQSIFDTDHKGRPILETVENLKAEDPEKRYNSLDIEDKYERMVPENIQEGTKISLEYIKELYNISAALGSCIKLLDPEMRLQNLLYIFENRVNGELGRTPPTRKDIARYYGEDEKEKEEIENQFGQMKLSVYEKLYDLIDHVNTCIHDRGPKYVSWGVFQTLGVGETALRVKKLNPEKWMFWIWSKEIKRGMGEYRNHKILKLCFKYHKKQSKGTDRNFLFNAIDEDVTTFETIRKVKINSSDRERIVDFIHSESFIERRSTSEKMDEIIRQNWEWLRRHQRG